ncbi:hypothetical protein HAX54_041092 [Datura stramonium]|uniref:Alpha-carbonic anhydrase domain-containing protein n=1 Tax=Datura stramonium TaxID=4076 RepID=A0ABS8RP20_DATST|nr:hypothetical protein [Datura stramonium]
MRQQRYLPVLAILYFVIIFFSATSIRAQEVEDEREFDYGENSEKGPKMWGKLKKEWEACQNGEMQSPIDMCHERVRINRKPEKRHYKPCNATVKNRGHDISYAERNVRPQVSTRDQFILAPEDTALM